MSEEWFSKNLPEKESWFYLLFKKIIDLFFACVGLVLLFFLYPILGLLIKLESDGKILYKQQRKGKNGIIFTLYKFRTMYEIPEDNCQKWREKDKNSITKIGKFLRITHLDEVPQAINLFSGELSFVGPRAEWSELAEIFEKEIPYYRKRYLVKPGMMGWAQINFPASRSVEEAKSKFEYDLYYIKNRSLLLDLEIISKSLKLYFF